MADPIYRTAAWRKVRLLVLARDGYRCQVWPGCERVASAVDHIHPWRQGGAWYDPRNLRASCVYHNSQRVSRPGRANGGTRRPSKDWFEE